MFATGLPWLRPGPERSETWRMGDVASPADYDPDVVPSMHDRIRDYQRSPVGQMQREYRAAPKDVWKKNDPIPGLGGTTQAQIEASGFDLPERALKSLMWGGPADAAIGLGTGAAAANLLPPQARIPARVGLTAAGVIGALMDPAEAASAKAVLSSTDVLDRLKPGVAEFWHRIANRKLDRRLQDIPYTESGQAPPMSSLVDPSTLVGKFLMPLPGDPTKRGKVIESIDNVKLSDPFLTEGGRAYIDELGGFANAPAAASAAAQRIKAIQDKFNTDVYGTYTKMGPQSADFSGHTWALLARMFPNAPMSKTGVANMDKAFRDGVAAIKPTKAMVKAGEEYVWPKQPPSVTADVFEQYLAGHPDMYRKAFINATEKARGTIPGVPDVIAARYAATDPTLLNARTNSSGLTMTKLTGATRPSTHPDYPVHLEGEGSFGLGQMLPREVMYPDLVRHFDKQGVEPNFWLRKMQMPPAEIPYGQLVTPEWAKNTTRYIDDTKQMGESAALNKYMLEHFGWK